MDDRTKKQIEEIVSDRRKFDEFIYTPFDEAIKEMDRRFADPSVPDIPCPPVLKDGFKAVLFRHVATPNHEVRRFMNISDAVPHLKSIILEYAADTFTNRNDWKYSLGRLSFYKGRDKAGDSMIETHNVIDFNTSNGKPIRSIQTLWGQSLVDFHHELFLKEFKDGQNNIFDLSEWVEKNGNNPLEYYRAFFLFFLKNGILFENFLLHTKEATFTKEVIVPAFMDVMKKTGLKPLIVPLEPIDTEEDRFWLFHLRKYGEFVKGRKNSAKKKLKKR